MLRTMGRILAMAGLALALSGCIHSERDVGEVLTPVTTLAPGTYKALKGKDKLMLVREGDGYVLGNSNTSPEKKLRLTFYQLDKGLQLVKIMTPGDRSYDYSFFKPTATGFVFEEQELADDEKLSAGLRDKVARISDRHGIFMKKGISAGELVIFLRAVYKEKPPTRILEFNRM